MPELQTLLKEVVKLPASYRRQGPPLASLLAQVAKGVTDMARGSGASPACSAI
ncbi:hypothetical protein [Gluconobacter oxydans]|uniref:hypothetical protein n=1 Tax=Gluconobacter oxydans TaxID=442 RepID=UPI000B1D1644|nr:hypothetical protein [Gluconobacter oxydans]